MVRVSLGDRVRVGVRVLAVILIDSDVNKTISARPRRRREDNITACYWTAMAAGCGVAMWGGVVVAAVVVWWCVGGVVRIHGVHVAAEL